MAQKQFQEPTVAISWGIDASARAVAPLLLRRGGVAAPQLLEATVALLLHGARLFPDQETE
eukprot:2401974-Amphidinium_carterae.1